MAVTAEFLVDSINGLTASGAISKEFVGVILLPIVGNAAEHVTAVTVSVKDKITLSLGVAVGSSIVGLFPMYLSVITDCYPANCTLRYSVRFIYSPLPTTILFIRTLIGSS